MSSPRMHGIKLVQASAARRSTWIAAALVMALAAVAQAGDIHLRETFEGARADGRILPADTTGLFPPADIGNAGRSCFFAHDQGMIGAGLAGSKLALRAVDSADGGSALRADWSVRADRPAPSQAMVQFDLRLTGLAPSPRVKSPVPFTVILRDKDNARPLLTTIVHQDREGFAVRTRAVSRDYDLHGQAGDLLGNDHDYRFTYLLELPARRFSLTVTDLADGSVVIAPNWMPLATDLPEAAAVHFVSVSFGAPDFASRTGAPGEFVTFDNLLVCDPDVKNGLEVATSPAP